MRKAIYKRWWFWLIVFALIYGAFEAKEFFDWKGRHADRFEQQRQMFESADLYQKQIEDYKKAMKADKYGGETPEETWTMFIDALEAGDTDLAAKYFVLEKQDEMLSNFELGKKSGALKSFLENDTTLISGNTMYESKDRFEFYTDDIDGGPGFVYMLVLNKETNLWKIESL